MTKEILNTTLIIDDCIELAAEHLPVGWGVVITIEKNGYGVRLVNPACEDFDLYGGDGLRSDIVEGINIANGFKQ
tara:strand:+ start:39264 stop:39488 length:225 start_codon:yes stop_codon:yes gene_type:complete